MLFNKIDITNEFKIIEVRHLPGNAYILKLERNGLQFEAGQHVQIAPLSNYNLREYSIYSGIQENYLEILIKVVADGYLSNRLKNAKPGDYVQLYGPIGYFTIDKKNLDKPFLFIASGSGIAPFHSFVSSYANLNYTLIHGVKHHYEAYEKEFYAKEKYIQCTSQDTMGNYSGRLTRYIEENSFDFNSEVYLCGNNLMIADAMNILVQKGFRREQMHTEVYF